MSIIKVQVRMSRRSGVDRDEVTNTFHFKAMGNQQADEQLYQALAGALSRFWTDPRGVAQVHLRDYLSPCMSRQANSNGFKFWKFEAGDDPNFLGTPDYEQLWNVGGDNAPFIPLPAEVAVCLSMLGHSAEQVPEEGPNGTRPRSHYRNRVFLGPWNRSAIAQDADTGEATVIEALRDGITGAAVQLDLDAQAFGHRLAVYSPALRVALNIGTVWVDDAFDTQRRRGEVARVRTSIAGL